MNNPNYTHRPQPNITVLQHSMRLIAPLALLALAIGFIAVTALLPRPAAAQTAPSKGAPDTGCILSLQLVSSPNTGDESTLRDIAAVSSDDIWVVGYYINGANSRTLIEHWNGTIWSIVPSPNIGTASNYLQAVDGRSANDVWAAGFFLNGATEQSLILHWNGSAWTVSPSANAGSNDTFLYDVKAVSANDGWAVGYYYSGPVERTLILRWNGSTWTVFTSPNSGANTNGLQGLTVIAQNDAWAVGWYDNGTTYRTLTLHWNGTNWTIVASANQGTGANYLYDVKATAANNVWAVGAYRNSGIYQTLILRWNGSAWSVVPSPNVGADANALLGMAVVSASDIWAVGYSTSGTTIEHTLAVHWDGSTWSVVTSSNANVDQNRLYRVAVVNQNDVWAAGYSKQTIFQTLVEHYSCGSCTIQFSDVPQGSPFYDFVMCMACQGIINGYTSGCDTGNPCFRPNNNVTRGQLSKIVANAAGFSEPTGAQQYQDVPPASTFFDFIWRLSNRGYVGGYACGGLNEPCVQPDNLPYFRPNANATRGQISKIASNAANFTDPPGSQLFQDVAPASTFFDFVQRLANRGVMSGYACGGLNEPCHAGNLPYFRPNANATRGQTSKIISNTFFPGCSTRRE